MSPQSVSHNLLFGLLSLQNGLIDQAQLVSAFQAWMRDKSRSLGEHLIGRGDLDTSARSVVEALVALQLDKHEQDPEKSLASLPVGSSTRELLRALDDPELTASIVRAGSVATETVEVRTSTYMVGESTSDGQRFRVLRPHARGGLGAVFVAIDGELHREVALKQILDSHADDPTSRQRFLNEAEITGGLEHPGIVPVYGLGAYKDGRPYYAMRFIRGDSLKEAIERFHAAGAAATNAPEESGRRPGERESRDLELRRLLRRFLDVCNAIDYAHSRGVLHRDIKPGNIIIGKYGETLVVDWGLAKATGKSEPSTAERTLVPSSSSSSGAATLPGSAIGTPAYMSPEQAAGDLDQLGPPSDVYSLGATLYCLLTGKPPFVGNDLGLLLRKVQQGEFARPRQFNPSIDKALEAVCLKAMALTPADRYATPKALADDVDRWLADEPVSAWKEPWTRKSLRWITRHRVGVTAAAAAGLVALVGLGAVAFTQAKGRAALEIKNQELAAANGKIKARYELAVDAIKTFHTGVSEDFLLKEDKFKALRDRLLNSASEFYSRLSRLLGNETDFASRKDLAQSNFDLARLTSAVGRVEEGLAAHRKVLALRQAMMTEPEPHDAMDIDVAASLIEVAHLLDSTGNTAEAVLTYRKADDLLTRSAPRNPDARNLLAHCRMSMGYLLYRTGNSQQGLVMLRDARNDLRTLVQSSSASIQTRRDLGSMAKLIGNVLAATGEQREAEAEYREAVTVYRQLVGSSPTAAESRNALASALTDLATHIDGAGRASEAKEAYSEALTIQQGLVRDYPAVMDFSSRLANTHDKLASSLERTGDIASSELNSRRASAIREQLVRDNPNEADFQVRLADSQNNLAMLLRRTGRLDEAESRYRAALGIYERVVKANSDVTVLRAALASTHQNLAVLLFDTGKPTIAMGELRKAQAILRELADEHPEMTDFQDRLANSHNDASMYLSRIGKAEMAFAESRQAETIWRKLANDNAGVPAFRHRLAGSHLLLGDTLVDLNRLDEAEHEYRLALEIQQAVANAYPNVPDYQTRLANTHLSLAMLFSRLERLDQSEVEFDLALGCYEKLVREFKAVTFYQTSLANCLIGFGAVRERQRRFGDALGLYKRSLAIWDHISAASPTELYNSACLSARMAALAHQPGAGLSAADGKAAEEKAMQKLLRAIGLGYRNVALISRDPDLNALRDRDDFKSLMLDLAMPADPFAP